MNRIFVLFLDCTSYSLALHPVGIYTYTGCWNLFIKSLTSSCLAQSFTIPLDYSCQLFIHMVNVRGRFCFYNLLSFLLPLFVFFLSFFFLLIACLIALFFVILTLIALTFYLGVLYSFFSSLDSPEFKFLVETSYLGSFLYMGICYPFHLCIWVPSVYLSLSEC